MCILNVLCQLQVKYYISNVFNIKCKYLKLNNNMNFMVARYINNIEHFIFQLMHTNCKILRLLK